MSSDSLIPLYARLGNTLKEQIIEGYYKPGDMIPSEIELGKHYGVSRITVRKAVEGLVLKGLLEKKQGIGTCVRSPRLIDETSNLKSFTEKISGSSIHFSTQVLRVEIIPADEILSCHMQVPEGERVVHIARVRSADGVPIGYFENYISSITGLGLDEDYSKSIYSLIEHKCGIAIREARKEIASVAASERIQSILQLKEAVPLLSIKTYSCDYNDNIVDFSDGYYRSDRYNLIIHLNREQEFPV
ncbi:MAG: GntR family transcriptional regulator [Spirochaetales bacterium]|nr:MAG: GntR family transcriptional regulator [Spirochaetales bacterium]